MTEVELRKIMEKKRISILAPNPATLEGRSFAFEQALKIVIPPKSQSDSIKYLARCVELLRDQTEKSCEKKMQDFIY